MLSLVASGRYHIWVALPKYDICRLSTYVACMWIQYVFGGNIHTRVCHSRYFFKRAWCPCDFIVFITCGQKCSVPWGVLSSDVNSDKTWLSTVLLRIALDCPYSNVLYDRGFLSWNDLNPTKIDKSPLGSWIQGSAGIAGSLTFSQFFVCLL